MVLAVRVIMEVYSVGILYPIAFSFTKKFSDNNDIIKNVEKRIRCSANWYGKDG